MVKKIFLYLFVASLFVQAGCQASKTAKGVVIGAAAGAVAGGLIGKKGGNTVTGAILGAAVGGVAGAAIGRYMDRQSTKLERELGEDATVERVGEGIHITFESGILFDVSKADLKGVAKENLTKLASTLKEYPDTIVLIEGHTDSSGSDEFNQKLSERRAGSVSSYLQGQSIGLSRLQTKGYGESQPIASNETAAGKQQNRRVELAIYANDDLKKKAKEGKI